VAEGGLGVVEDLAGGELVGVGLAVLAGDDGRVVEQAEELAGVLGEQDLLLGALDDGGGAEVVGLLELLAGDVGELGLGDEGLGFGADELLLEGDEFGGFGLLLLELGDFVEDLRERDVSVCSSPHVVHIGRIFLTLALWLRVGCTLDSVLRICFRVPRLSSRFWAKTSSCSAISESSTASLSEMSLKLSSSVASPQSLSWLATPCDSFPACS
jgi:hypothetical protein